MEDRVGWAVGHLYPGKDGSHLSVASPSERGTRPAENTLALDSFPNFLIFRAARSKEMLAFKNKYRKENLMWWGGGLESLEVWTGLRCHTVQIYRHKDR